MIEARDLCKKFSQTHALKNLSCRIPDGCVYGLVGSNGAGKSTFLRLIADVYRPSSGEVLIDGQPVSDNPAVKSRVAFVPDDIYFLPRASLDRMAKLYASVYPNFSYKRYAELVKLFCLNRTSSLAAFSKGMRRQAATLLALACSTDYVLFDETFDGLDPVVRNTVKNLLYEEVCSRNKTVIVTSHSLRELEDTCDQLALLHNGRIVFESDISNLKTAMFKIQVAFAEDFDRTKFEGIEIKSFGKKGSVASIIVKGDRDAVSARIKAMNPLLFEILPLSLEEVFVYEMDALGYSSNIVLG